MGDRQNRTRAAKYRELVELLLTAEDVPVKVRPTYAKLSDVFAAEEPPASDIDGLESWAVLVRADYRHDWSGALDAAQEAARLDGKPHAAVIQSRAGRRGSESYVSMTLTDFAAILRRDAEVTR